MAESLNLFEITNKLEERIDELQNSVDSLTELVNNFLGETAQIKDSITETLRYTAYINIREVANSNRQLLFQISKVDSERTDAALNCISFLDRKYSQFKERLKRSDTPQKDASKFSADLQKYLKSKGIVLAITEEMSQIGNQ